jgi:hypothetical protein
MKLVARTELEALAVEHKKAFMNARARANAVVYEIGGFKFSDSASKALFDAGFTEYELTIYPDAKALLKHEAETLDFLAQVFSRRGSLRDFAVDHKLDYMDVLGVVAHARRIRHVQIPLAKFVKRTPQSLWPDFEDSR